MTPTQRNTRSTMERLLAVLFAGSFGRVRIWA